MSYYILPKKNIDFDIQVTYSVNNKIIEPIVSFSLFYYLSQAKLQVCNIVREETESRIIRKHEMVVQGPRYRTKEKEKEKENTDITLEFLNKILNPYEFIFSYVPQSILSVSKLRPYSNIFYIFMEIIQMFNLLDFFEDKNINTIHYGPNSPAVVECLDMLREDSNDVNWKYPNVQGNKWTTKDSLAPLQNLGPLQNSNVSFLSYELHESDYKNNNKYFMGVINILCNIICNQSMNGVAIIKLHNIFYKPIIDVLFMLTSMYEKIYIIKPNNTNMFDSERYIICKNFILNQQRIVTYNYYLYHLNNIVVDKEIVSIIKNDLPYYFMNKIEESNIIIGHQQLEYIDHLISLYKSKNREDKIEIIKKNNIQKCILWCDKFKIPYNKFTDRINIFLQQPSASVAVHSEEA